eukprot:4779870-Ditylum_brightwellii.AAC.1
MEEDGISTITGVSGIAHRNEEQEEEDELAVTGMTGLPVASENNSHPPNWILMGSLGTHQEEDQTAEELDNDVKLVMAPVTGIQMSQEKQTEDDDDDEEDDKADKEAHKKRNMVNERLMSTKNIPHPMTDTRMQEQAAPLVPDSSGEERRGGHLTQK